MSVATTPSPASRSAVWRRPGVLLAAGAAVLLGISIGREIAFYESAGGESILGVAFLIVLAAIGTIATWIVWLILAWLLRRSVRAAIASLAVVSAAFVVGILAGTATAGATGATYHPPVTLHATATIQANLAFHGQVATIVRAGTGTCDSDPDTNTIASITALDLGNLGTGKLRGLLTFSANGRQVDGWVLVDGSDNDPEQLPIRWEGTLQLMELATDRTTGDVFLPDIPLGVDPKLPDASIAPEWPRALAGDISWTCQPWDE